jgi:hypothetical protein
MKSIKNQKIQDEIFFRLVEATAQTGTFNLGELKNAQQCQSIAKHLKGVSEIIAAVYTAEAESSEEEK